MIKVLAVPREQYEYESTLYRPTVPMRCRMTATSENTCVGVYAKVCVYVCRESEKTKLLISQQTQKVVEKEAETERIKAVIGETAKKKRPWLQFVVQGEAIVRAAG